MIRIVELDREVLPVTLQDAKDHCRAPADNSDDDLIRRALGAAVEFVSSRTSRVLTPRTLLFTADEWPWYDCQRGLRPGLDLEVTPVRDVLSVKYMDEDNVEQTVSSGLWHWDHEEDGGARVQFADSFTYPNLVPERRGSVRVEFTAGFDDPEATGSGEDPNLVAPERAIQLVLLLTQHWYDHRGVSELEPGTEVFMAAEALINDLRVYR